jgi:4-alpha-glucanotransferase
MEGKLDQFERMVDELASLMGIEAEYADIWGNKHPTSLDTKLLILEAMGLNTGSEKALQEQLTRRHDQEWTRLGPPPVWVTYVDTAKPIPIQVAIGPDGGDEIPQRDRVELEISIEDEDGRVRRERKLEGDLQAAGSTVINGIRYHRYLLEVPSGLEPGYYTLTVDIMSHQGRFLHPMRLVICPEKAYMPPVLQGNGKAAGVQAALYGLRSSRNWGIGDFTDLKTLVDWTADTLGGDIIGLNPLLAIHNRPPYNHCPYLPITRFFRNFIYLDVEAVAGFSESPAIQEMVHDPGLWKKVEALRASPEVCYEEVATLKRRVLKEAFQSFLTRPIQDAERTAFQKFVDEQGELLDLYATFMALYEYFEAVNPLLRGWPNWPPEYLNPSSPAVKTFKELNAAQVLFHKFLQWEVERQLDGAERHCKDRGLAINFYHDLPLAVDNTGLDAWLHQKLFASHMSTGAPPDPFSPNGQNWGFAPPLPEALLQDGYAFFIQEVRRNMRPDSALRLDHAMRFFRLFWIPEDRKAAEGAYVRYCVDDLVGILVLESVRNRTLIIAEDLGTVPPIVRKIFAQRGIFSYRLLYFERDDGGNFKLPQAYPEQALVSISTHDLPTFEGFWNGSDLEIRHRLGKFDSEDRYHQEWRAREQDKARLLSMLKAQGLLPDYHPVDLACLPRVTPEMHNAVVGFVANTCSKVLLINQEDIFRDDRQQNMPGTTWEVHNWVTKMRFSLEELASDPVALGCTRMVWNWVQVTGRGGKRG